MRARTTPHHFLALGMGLLAIHGCDRTPDPATTPAKATDTKATDTKAKDTKVKDEPEPETKDEPEPAAMDRSVLHPDIADMSADFPDFGFMIAQADFIDQYPDQEVFRLKTDFPKVMPPASALPPAMMIDFKTDPEAYLRSVQDYCFEGNTPQWDPHDNETRGWYHIPWLHPSSESGYPPNGGTEGFHGLIKEAAVDPLQLGAKQKGSYQVYAITLINELAGYTMGKMWADPDDPDFAAADDRFGGGFPEGTVFCKLLFTDAPQGADELPFLENPLQWTAYITKTWDSEERAALPVNLLQMDIMVRDSRAAQTGWVFGTFVYNGQLGNDDKFRNLVPLGLQWGNDPDNRENKVTSFPYTETQRNPELKETIVLDSEDIPAQHLGWNGRLNGPADLNTSSCMSCHFAASFPAITSLVADGMVGSPVMPPPQGGTDEWMRWFTNYSLMEPMGPKAYQTGLSMQVAISLENFRDVKNRAYQGHWANEYSIEPVEIAR